MNKVRIGLIGCGNIARAHAAKLANIEHAQLAAFTDMREEAAQDLASKYGGRAYAQYEAMLDKERLDAVMLCTPHQARIRPVEAIAGRKLALFCEKPPAFTIQDARTCIRHIDQAGILNTVGLMYRWQNISDKARELIAGQAVNICQITGCWSVIDWYRKGSLAGWFMKQDQTGGPMVEQGIHLLDVARYILQDDVAEVHGFGSNLLEPKSSEITINDTVQANLRFAKGTVGSHVHSWSYAGWIFQIRFIGADFELLWDVAGNRLTGTIRGAKISYESNDDPYEKELRGFVQAVTARDQSLLRSTYADACKTLAGNLAIVKSVETGRVEKVETVI